ncbi:MAG: D-alanyl-D-alanine carboxypeptidase family protein [Bacillota bacterium]
MACKVKLAAALMAALFFICPSPSDAGPPRISADSVILMDAESGQVLYEKNGFARKEPASLTKIITAILALEYGHPDEVATVSKRSASISVGQELRLAAGDRITLGNLVKAALMYSANDSTVAIAEHIAGTEDRFVELMNAKALVLGALHTRFANTNGYHHPNHYSTAYDLAIITRYAITNQDFARIIKTPRDTIQWADGDKKVEINNTNRLVRDNSYEGILGVKTGSTIRAGNCLIAAAQRDGRTIIAVVLHSRNRYKDAVKLLDYGFHDMMPVELCRRHESFGKLPVAGGIMKEVEAVTGDGVTVYLSEEDRGRVIKKVLPEKRLNAPVRAGQRVGAAVFTLRGKELARVSLIAAREVKKPGIIYRIRGASNIYRPVPDKFP